MDAENVKEYTTIQVCSGFRQLLRNSVCIEAKWQNGRRLPLIILLNARFNGDSSHQVLHSGPSHTRVLIGERRGSLPRIELRIFQHYFIKVMKILCWHVLISFYYYFQLFFNHLDLKLI